MKQDIKKIMDVLIIGAGPIGLACGIEAKKAHLSYLILEKGCLVNSIYHYPKNMTFFSTSEKIEIGDVPFISHSPRPTRSEALEYYRRVTMSWNLKVNLYEKVISIHRDDVFFKISTTKNQYYAKHIIISSGFYDIPFTLNIPGEKLPKVKHYYDDPHPYFNMNVVVVGAANSAVDVSLEIHRKGAKSVTMVIREEEISHQVKYWVRPDIVNRINEGSIQAFFNSSLTRIEEKSVKIDTPEGAISIPNDFVLAMTGYQPNFSLLENLGIKLQNDSYKTPVYDKNSMETNVRGIYLAGVICGGLKTNIWFIENSRIHAQQIIKHIMTNNNL